LSGGWGWGTFQAMEQDPRQIRQFADAKVAAAEEIGADEGHGLDRLVTAVALVATVALILFSPLAS
jgi:hypothetical protein